MELFSIVTLRFGQYGPIYNSVEVGVFNRSKRLTRHEIGSNFTHKNSFD